MNTVLQKIAGALDSALDGTPPPTGGPSWCRQCLLTRVKGKAVAEVAALREWWEGFVKLAKSFDGLMKGTAASRRAQEIIESLDVVTDGENLRELTGELRLIELADGKYGGQLRHAAFLRMGRAFAEAGPLIDNLVAAAEKELDKLAVDAAAREAKAEEALRDLLGASLRPSPLTAKIEAARGRFRNLRTEFDRQHNATHWNGRNPGIVEWVLLLG